MSRGPRLVLTAIVDPSARPAALTDSHGAAYAKLLAAARGQAHAGISLVELTIPAPVFAAARKALGRPKSDVALYDLVPSPASLADDIRSVAARFLAAETIWSLAEEGKLGEAALDVRIPVPAGWSRDPRAIQERLVEAGALDLDEADVASFQAVRAAFQP